MGEMAAAGGGSAGEIGRLSLPVNGHPRDLLRRFEEELHRRNQRTPADVETEEEDSGGVELSLGLSLGGRFGVDPYEKKRLLRSSSIGGLATISNLDDIIGRKDGGGGGGGGVGGGGLTPVGQGLARTVSLPVDTEEDRRKRKEIQSLRRLEAKRKRSEKQRNSNCRPVVGRKEEEKKGSEEEGLSGLTMKSKAPQSPINGFPVGVWGGSTANEKGGTLSRCDGLARASQVSLGSQGSVSSGASDFESRLVAGMSNTGNESRSPTSVHSPQDGVEKMAGATLSSATDNAGRNWAASSMGGEAETSPSAKNGSAAAANGLGPLSAVVVAERETGRSVMEEMPCVSTTGCGPNGRRVEGFLYKYRKGEDVSIVCVCHGSFLSPAEFVKHAGGGDVAHPLRHIVVNPSPPT